MAYDARYWREQAALCLEIARQISDRCAADQMLLTAAEYFARAQELERRRAEAYEPKSASPPAA